MAGFAPLVYASDVDKDVLRRATLRGDLIRLASGIYASETNRNPQDIVASRLWEVVGHELPGAVIVDRSARNGGRPVGGELYVASTRSRPLDLPGVRVVSRPGAGHLPGDMQLPDGIFIAGPARALLENLTPSKPRPSGQSRRLSRPEVELWLDELCATRGEIYLNRLRDEARELAPALNANKEFQVLDGLISAALATRDDVKLQSRELQARSSGEPIDNARIALFARLVDYLEGQAPDVLAQLPQDRERRSLLPFYEAYFSNYIEGTEFTLDEAAKIVFDHEIPDQRPQDAHDILGTYQITSSVPEMRRSARTADELAELLRARHAVLMAGRPEMLPGQFKERANRAGSTEFVAPDLVAGTLRRGFEVAGSLLSPFSRAVFMMFLVSEVHPFADGNGRVARLMMNSELEAAGEVRLIVPTVYRLNYLSALKAATHTGNFAALMAVLVFARKWTARVDFTSRDTAEGDFVRTHALRDAREAEEAGVRLQLP